MKNNRTFLEKLLDGAEVEWKPLGDVCNFQNGFAFKSSLFKDNGAPIVRITNIDGKEVNLSDVKYFLLDDYNTDMTPYKVHKGDILIAMSGATTGKIGFYNYEHPSYLNQRVGKFLPNTNILNNRYLYHYLLSKVEDIYIISGGGAQPNLSSNRLMSEVLIPIPPLSVQTEIVKILDALTALTSELTSELILRQKQYEYYREKLLSEEELEKVGGEWKNLKDILINLRTGLNPRNNFKLNTDGAENYYITVRELDSVNIKITDKTDKISNQAREIIDKRSKLNIGDILFSGTGTIGKTAFISELPRNWNIKEGVYALTVNQEIIKPMYLLRLLQSEITKKQINNFVMGSTVKSISMADLKKVKILIPSLDEQQCIVSILDKFETLTNSITEGLPLAIEQSQKRYEYYRELLLNFPGRE